MLKKIFLGFLLACVFSSVSVASAEAATQRYKFYFYDDVNTSSDIDIGDTCLRGVTLHLGLSTGMPNPPYIWTYVPLAGSSFTITNNTEKSECTRHSTPTPSRLTIGSNYALKDPVSLSTTFFTATSSPEVILVGLQQ